MSKLRSLKMSLSTSYFILKIQPDVQDLSKIMWIMTPTVIATEHNYQAGSSVLIFICQGSTDTAIKVCEFRTSFYVNSFRGEGSSIGFGE